MGASSGYSQRNWVSFSWLRISTVVGHIALKVAPIIAPAFPALLPLCSTWWVCWLRKSPGPLRLRISVIMMFFEPMRGNARCATSSSSPPPEAGEDVLLLLLFVLTRLLLLLTLFSPEPVTSLRSALMVLTLISPSMIIVHAAPAGNGAPA